MSWDDAFRIWALQEGYSVEDLDDQENSGVDYPYELDGQRDAFEAGWNARDKE
jgi:hypothetical protein